MIFYVVDTTLASPTVLRFGSYPEIVSYLEKMSIRAFGQNKTQRTRLLEEIGYGIDDHSSTLFVRSMQEQFEIGVVRDHRQMKCDITTIVAFQSPEYGD